MSNLAFSYQDTLIEAGCDEAGRGCLAGPVFAAAVILDPKMDLSELNDSKKLSAKKREELREIIEEGAVAWAVAQLSPAEIDKHNILQASFLAMHRALDQLTITPELLLIDGNRFRPYKEIPHHCMIKGDGRFLSIAAASILAKTHRDEYMLQQAEKYPEYGWSSNKGYPTKAHRAAIAQFGATPLHRKSFRLLPEAEQKKLSFED
ncbi:ribonuclease HII [Saprospira grandis]|uniref:Ribonuclease HII n=1 Tax=Saprospira grandis (strain Lewin) TaxID=984262 RepID=H6L6Q1_SAPGL|nr:ribonuclease HII [Saprospira grandis]AFC25297.1 ribonuclease HII [Saprospira grandis str. Lewin]